MSSELKILLPFLNTQEKELLDRILTNNALWLPLPGPQLEAYISPAQEIFYGGQAGGGKLQPFDSQVVTPFGFRSIGDLKVGDTISNPAGTTSKVVAIFPHREMDIYNVEFADGTIVECGLKHLWAAWRAHKSDRRKRNIPYLVLTTKHLMEWLDAGETVLIPVTEPINFTKAYRPDWNVRPIEAYTLGALLGDGYLPVGKITTADDEIAEALGAIFSYHKEGNAAIDYRVPNVLDGLERLQLRKCRSWEKFIPRPYLFAPTNERWALLQGLMDTDGTVSKGRGRVSFTTTSPQLAKDMRTLILSLGGTVMVDARQTHYTYNDEKRAGRPSSRLRIKLASNRDAFRLKRKKKLCQPPQNLHRKILDIRRIGKKEAVCIAIDHPNGLYLTDDFVVTHNTDLVIGLALTAHTKSVIFRREFPQLKDVVLRTHELLGGTGASFNSNTGMWRGIPDGRILELGSCQHDKDVVKYKGRPHDLVAFDEVPDFSENQFRFLTGWARTTDPDQRVRIVATGNPPTTPEGRWVVEYWAPWLDGKHDNPALPGELRWFARIDDEDIEVADGQPFKHNGETIQPKSRTFIPARLSDNPYLANTGYEAILQGLPEPLRSQLLYGDFTIGTTDDPWQIIPTEWVRLAQERWKRREKPDGPMTCLGVDAARGGKDKMVMAPRWGNWFGELMKYPGRIVDDGPKASSLVVGAVNGDKTIFINLDVVAIGSSPYDILRSQGFRVKGVNFGEGTRVMDKSKRLQLRNVRAEAYWGMREDLDPHDGQDLALPDDPELLADLTAPKWKITTQGIQVESKQEIIKRLKRSPDCGDAVVLANMKRRGVLVG